MWGRRLLSHETQEHPSPKEQIQFQRPTFNPWRRNCKKSEKVSTHSDRDRETGSETEQVGLLFRLWVHGLYCKRKIYICKPGHQGETHPAAGTTHLGATEQWAVGPTKPRERIRKQARGTLKNAQGHSCGMRWAAISLGRTPTATKQGNSNPAGGDTSLTTTQRASSKADTHTRYNPVVPYLWKHAPDICSQDIHCHNWFKLKLLKLRCLAMCEQIDTMVHADNRLSNRI